MKADKLLVAGGLVIDPVQGVEGVRDILIENGRVNSLGRPGFHRPAAGTRVLDAAGLWVLPGPIDLHVHLRDPGPGDDEDIRTGTEAAARGGVTTVLAMPNTEPVVDSAARVRSVREKAKRRAVVNVLVCGAVTRGQSGAELCELDELAEAGAVAFSDDGRPVMNAELMRRALVRARRLGLPVLDHSEDLDLSGAGIVHDGSFARRRKLMGIPSASEALMAQRDAYLAGVTGGHLHLCHVSCADTVAVAREAKRRGLPVTAEAAPHHFTLTDADIPDEDANFKMRPPLRSLTDRAALWEALSDGTIDAIATDHAPHAAAAKAAGIRKAPFGVIGLETVLPLSLALVARGVITRRQLADRLSAAPARILGLRRKGTLRPGADADLVVVDPKAEWRVDGFRSKSSNSPFVGKRLRGRAVWTIVNGKIVYDLKEEEPQ